MTGGLKPYPKMKDSGVEWLGEVPEHWETRKLKYGVSFSGGGTPSKNEDSFWNGSIPWVSPKDMRCTRIIDTIDHISSEAVTSSATSLVLPGALLMVVRSGILRRTIPVAVNSIEVALNQDMKALIPKQQILQSEYLCRLVEGNETALICEWTKQGATVESIEHELLANSCVPIPSLSEQAAIVRYLDHVTRRIDKLVRLKKRKIKLLEEEKQAIIHRAVTGGLDPDVPLKDSGVEALGEVPEHWEVRRGKYFFREVDERSATGLEELLSVSHLTGVTPRSHKNITMFKAESYVGSKICRLGQIAINTMWAWMGPIGVSKHHGIVSPSYHTYEQKQPARFTEEYLDLLVRTDAYKTLYRINSTGITSSRMRLYPEEFLNIEFLCPPLEEQNALLDSIRVMAQGINTAISRAKREIDLLNEYRTRLIADVVTGKLDVREAAAALPDVDPLVGADEPLDGGDSSDDTPSSDSEETRQ